MWLKWVGNTWKRYKLFRSVYHVALIALNDFCYLQPFYASAPDVTCPCGPQIGRGLQVLDARWIWRTQKLCHYWYSQIQHGVSLLQAVKQRTCGWLNVRPLVVRQHGSLSCPSGPIYLCCIVISKYTGIQRFLNAPDFNPVLGDEIYPGIIFKVELQSL